MCGCEAHWNPSGKCTCHCLEHQEKRKRQTMVSEPQKIQYWVTERAIGLEPPNDQMRFLNDIENEADLKYELLGCDPHGHYIFRVTQ